MNRAFNLIDESKKYDEVCYVVYLVYSGNCIEGEPVNEKNLMGLFKKNCFNGVIKSRKKYGASAIVSVHTGIVCGHARVVVTVMGNGKKAFGIAHTIQINWMRKQYGKARIGRATWFKALSWGYDEAEEQETEKDERHDLALKGALS